MAGSLNKEIKNSNDKKPSFTSRIWSLDDFVNFVKKVVVNLNEIGYSLKIPEKSRMENLLDKTSRGDRVYGMDAW